MNKPALKRFATEARRELLERVELQARKIGITSEGVQKATVESSDSVFIDGKQLTEKERVQRNKLISRIHDIGFDRVMEEVAYTWFNRFTALRFMEVNDYLPTKVRVLSSLNPDSAEPDMMKEALSLDLELDKEFIYDLKMANKNDELFKYLIIKHCNDLNKYMPFMFEEIDDYTEILFPDGLLSNDSFINQMVDNDVILEGNWKEVEIIGWLYQYYIAEEKDRVIKSKKKYKTEEIPFATQLFTPDWIVQYMVENTLGRYWVEAHDEHKDLTLNWDYFIEPANASSDFNEKLAPYINKELRVEDIKCFDPAMGSGHILVYLFDVLFEIYTKCGYTEREIPKLIIENNIYGLDIDDRAFQLASFSIIMKALKYNSRFLRSIERESLNMNLASIQETNIFNEDDIAYIAGGTDNTNYYDTLEFIKQFNNAKTIGSLINIKNYNQVFLEERFNILKDKHPTDLFEESIKIKIFTIFENILKQTNIMIRQYDILVTNPPYMGSKYMNEVLSNFIKKEYLNTKSDTFSAFMEYCMSKVIPTGHLGFLTPYVWMFISTYENLRKEIVENKNISSLIQFEYNAFPEACVPVCTLTLRNSNTSTDGEYIKLSNFPGNINQKIKTLEALNLPDVEYRYTSNSKDNIKIPGHNIAFWVSQRTREIFESSKRLNEFAQQKTRISTGNNDRFMRRWFEVDFEKMCIPEKYEKNSVNSFKWFPYNKGGSFRRWYGNNYYVLNYYNNGEELKKFKGYSGGDEKFFFTKGLTWSSLTTGNISFRLSNEGFLSDQKGPLLHIKEGEENIYYLLGLLNSKVVQGFLDILSPTLDYIWGPISSIPTLINQQKKEKINYLVKESIKISKKDWDFSEISWDFKYHPLVELKENQKYLSEVYSLWENLVISQRNSIEKYEEEINTIFSSIYGLEQEISTENLSKEIVLKKVNKEEDFKSLISYAVGCMFGRYSLDEEGLIFGGGEFNFARYSSFKVDTDNIIPILSVSYFSDDIVSQFISFIEIVFGSDMLQENLRFLTEAIGTKENETSKETLRRYLLNEFYKNHIQVYKKRPIYWLFTSGKEKAFNCLIYMHRYDKTTLSRIRTDYLHEVQIRMDSEKKDLLNIIEGDSTAKEISNAKKELKSLDKKIDELKVYDEKLHHMADMQIEIDLDDGVVVNYAKFEGLVAKI